MFVTSVAGQRLGKVIRCDADTFIIEKGVFFPKDFELRYDHITDVADGQITYLLSDEYSMQGISPKAKAAGAAGAATGTVAAAAHGLKSAMRGAKEGVTERMRGAKEDKVERERGADLREDVVERERGAKVETRESEKMREPEIGAKPNLAAEKEIRIPLLAEEMDVEKVDREMGHVRIHKAVKTEERRVTVPLRREEVVIEHVSAATREGTLSADGAYREQTVDIPLHEEELLIGKHSVVREEVVVRTISQSVDKEGTASLRSEDLEIEDTRPLPKARKETGFGAPSAASPR